MFINNNLNKGISMPIAILVIMVAAVIGGGLVLWQYSEMEKETVDVSETEYTKIDNSGWKTYTNEVHGFELKYPANWTIKEETKRDIDSLKEKYRLDIFNPEDITEADIYGSIAVEFFVHEDDDKFFNQQLDLMKRDTTLAIEKITINDVKGFKGTSYQEAGKAKSMYILQLFHDKENRGIFKILVWTMDLGKKNYQEQANLILSSFKFIE